MFPIQASANSDSKYRLRIEGGGYSQNMDDSNDQIKTVNWSMIRFVFDKIGLGYMKTKFVRTGIPDNNNKFWEQGYDTDSILLSYMFGDSVSLELGTTIWVKGKAYVSTDDSYYETDKYRYTYSSIDHYLDSITLGFSYGGFEIIFSLGAQDYEFYDFKCSNVNGNSCNSSPKNYGDHLDQNNWGSFGIGFVF